MACTVCRRDDCSAHTRVAVETTIIDDKHRTKYTAVLRDLLGDAHPTCTEILNLSTSAIKLNLRRYHLGVQAHIRSHDPTLSRKTNDAMCNVWQILQDMFKTARLSTLQNKLDKFETYCKRHAHSDTVLDPAVNPYALFLSKVCTFRIADNYAVAHIDPRGYIMTKYRTLHVLQSLCDNDGHTCVQPMPLYVAYKGRYGQMADLATYKDYLRNMLVDGSLKKYRTNDEHTWLFLPKLFYDESTVARVLKASTEHTGEVLTREDVANIGTDLIEEQVDAIHAVFSRPASRTVITAPGGAGKSYCVYYIARLCVAHNIKFALAGPTGASAKRLKQLLMKHPDTAGHDCKTLHRLLGCRPLGNDDSQISAFSFSHDDSNPIPDLDLLVIDETGMVDISLGAAVLRALQSHVSIVFVGDTDQLPSIGPGAILRDLIACSHLPDFTVVHKHLHKVHRQAESSNIIMASRELVKTKRFPYHRMSGDVEWVDITNKPNSKVHGIICDLYQQFIANPDQTYHVCTPMRKKTVTRLDATCMNRMLQDTVFATRERLLVYESEDQCLYVGDRVMCTKNLNNHGVYNGDIGLVLGRCVPCKHGDIHSLAPDGVTIQKYRLAHSAPYNYKIAVAYSDDRTVAHDAASIYDNALSLAYVSSVAKVQGCEFDTVMVVLHAQTHKYATSLSLLYTAMTRAKKKLILVADKAGLQMAAEHRATVRNTCMVHMAA